MTINTLYICEKPSQGRDIAKVLGCHEKQEGFLKYKEIAVTWCFGHLLEAASPDHYCKNIKPWRMEILPIVPEKWQMNVRKEASKQVKIIKTLLKEANHVVIATDADREGEVIAREMLDNCRFKGTIQRLWLSALDETSIKKALSTMREGKTTENLYYAGLGRQRADWLVGMNTTMATSVLFGQYGEGVLSVGRVQTPTLKLIVDRDHTIEHFVSKEYFELLSDFTTDKHEVFSAKWVPNEQIVDAEGRVLDKQAITGIINKIKGQSAAVQKFDNKEKQQAAPLCLSLSQLQRLASNRYNYSAKETLEIAQSLYETHKATTYPRTDCGYLPESQFDEATLILSLLKEIHPDLRIVIDACDPHFRSPTWNDKKISAHHGMIPTTNRYVNLSKMNDREKKIYELICRYYIAQFLGHYEYAERSVVVNCCDELFKATSHTPLKPAWKRALHEVIEKEENEIDEVFSPIPHLMINDTLMQNNENLLAKHTKPPARFTEGNLILAMKSIEKYVTDKNHKKTLKETAGIGTEATRAAIIETLFKRSYVEKKGKQLFATEKGKKLIALLPAICCDPVLTAEWEEELDKIAEGQLTLDTFISKQKELLYSMLSAIQSSYHANPANKSKKMTDNLDAHHCPQCQKTLIKRQAKDKRYFWGCSAYPACRFTTNDQNGSPLLKLVKGETNEKVTK